ncbi:hypothetical protein [Nocardioides sp. TF02-7]|uniref:hypothetical protein n=1 Tax=Nocardioides sp. TF02-7 TaxID=2917724 RepID=UPI001F0574EA|nr:hypothetical protein [Nocardioides sp. TF02-7]UMG94424.1 hypothetical protein MF408_10815 [Nocardioides sp. TF02-7]
MRRGGRHAGAALASALVVTALLGPVPGDAAAVSTKPTVSPARPTAGQRVVVTGKVPTTVRRPVVVQRRAGSGWKVVGRARTSRLGVYRVRGRLPATTTVRTVARRVRVRGTTYRAWVSPGRRVTVRRPSPPPPPPPPPPDPDGMRLVSPWSRRQPGRRLQPVPPGSRATAGSSCSTPPPPTWCPATPTAAATCSSTTCTPA